MYNKRNILFLSPLSPVGGISSWTKNMLDYIQQEKIRHVHHVDGSILFKKPNNAIHPLYRLISGIMDTIHISYLLIKNCFKYRPEVIHVATPASVSLFKDVFYLFIANCFNSKCFFHYRFGRIPELSKQKNWEWKLICFNIKHSYRSIVIDNCSYAVLCEYGFKSKVDLIPNPCSPKLAKLATMEILGKKKDHFVFVGHVIKSKGIYELVSAFAAMEEELYLTMIGPYDEDTKNRLILTASNKKGDWLNFLGNQSSDVVISQMKTAEALILPSYTEGFPNVVLEAMAAGCPVLATPVGAIADMLDVDNKDKAGGICFERQSVNALHCALQQFLRERDLHPAYAVNGKKKVLTHYTMKSVFPLYLRTWGR